MNIFYYHKNCNDGNVSALIAWLKFGDDALYIAKDYKDNLDEVEVGDIVYLIDYSVKKDVAIDLLLKVKKLIVVDHHKTANKELIDLKFDKFEFVYDVEKSGAVLVWEYFNKDEKMPQLLLNVQDRDLWKFDLKNTNDIHNGLLSIEDFREMEKYLIDTNLNELILNGKLIKNFLDIRINKLIENVEFTETFFSDGEVIPLINLPGFLMSDGLSKVLNKYPEYDYAVGYTDLTTHRLYSLRSNGFDVSVIAKKHGGGGHQKAAGFELEKNCQYLNDN